MIRTSTIGWLLAFACAVTLPAFAEEAERRTRSALAGVRELDKPVTYSEAKIPLGELVQKVSRDTGVSLTAAKDVADEPVALLVKDFPARELLEQLADLLDYRWSRRAATETERRGDREMRRPTRDAGGATRDAASSSPLNAQRPTLAPQARYEIWQDLASKQREEALRRAPDAEERIREEVARVVAMAALPGEQLHRILEEDEKHFQALGALPAERRGALLNSPEERGRRLRFSAARALSQPVPRALAALIGRLTPRDWEALRRTGRLRFSTEPQAGELPMPLQVEGQLRTARPSLIQPGRRSPFRNAEAEERFRTREQELEIQWSSATGYRVDVWLNIQQMERDGTLRLSAAVTPFRGGAAPHSPLAGMLISSESIGGATSTPTSLLLYSGSPGAGRPEDTPERRAALEKDPVVGAPKSFKPRNTARSGAVSLGILGPFFHELAPELARTYDVGFISDAYWSDNRIVARTPESSAGDAVRLYTLLDRHIGITHRWDRQGELIRLRSRTWFFERPREVPLRFVRRWQALFDQSGALPLDEYLAIVTNFKESQIETLNALVNLREVPRDFYSVEPARAALRLYAAMTPAQRQELWQGRTIPAAQMTPPQRELLATVLAARRSPELPLPGPDDVAGGGFSLVLEPLSRTRHLGDARVYRDEPVPEPPAPLAPNAGTRYPVIRVQFQTHSGSETREAGGLVIAAPHVTPRQ